jgi:hypothetical protein
MELTNKIDFDEASREWRKNKVNCGKGYFKYKCHIENCNECVYSYTTNHKLFDKIATDFDKENRNHKNRDVYCEEHLLQE